MGIWKKGPAIKGLSSHDMAVLAQARKNAEAVKREEAVRKIRAAEEREGAAGGLLNADPKRVMADAARQAANMGKPKVVAKKPWWKFW